jgi:hypothetical protein
MCSTLGFHATHVMSITGCVACFEKGTALSLGSAYVSSRVLLEGRLNICEVVKCICMCTCHDVEVKASAESLLPVQSRVCYRSTQKHRQGHAICACNVCVTSCMRICKYITAERTRIAERKHVCRIYPCHM